MQNISCKNGLNRGTEAKIFHSSRQCQVDSEKLTSLYQQVADLKETVMSLENIIQLKDVQLENMQRDNGRLSVELKKQQRYVRNLKLGR